MNTGTVFAWSGESFLNWNNLLPQLLHKRFNILLVSSVNCTWYAPGLRQDSLPSPSAHFVSHSTCLSHLSLLISCSITFYTSSSSLPPLCFQLSLFLYYRKSLLSHVSEHSANVTKKTWYQLNRSALSRERSECFLAQTGWGHVCSGWTKGRDICERSLSLSFPCVMQTYCMSPGSYSICALLNLLLLCKNLGQSTTTLAKYFVYWS